MSFYNMIPPYLNIIEKITPKKFIELVNEIAKVI